ncbi:MAG: arginase family protein, partial [Chitinophagaceae bacterium]|nr:arginase family protein [Chitinophagaceae bacterium]
KPYVEDKHVIHIGQRDAEETKKYDSQNIRDTSINCFDVESIKFKGLAKSMDEIVQIMNVNAVDGYWIHFDTDVISDTENPAVDYRVPGGLMMSEVEFILLSLLQTELIAGMSISIFNPKLDVDARVAGQLVACIAKAFH